MTDFEPSVTAARAKEKLNRHPKKVTHMPSSPVSLEVLIQHWNMEARNLEDAAKQDDIGDEEVMLNKYVAEQLRKCIRDLEAVQSCSAGATTPVCCYCDAALSCASCGREQPADVAQPSWQPIETAPKNVRLLLFSPGHKISDDPDERPVVIASTTRDWNWATHWMPLPTPPVSSTPRETPSPEPDYRDVVRNWFELRTSQQREIAASLGLPPQGASTGIEWGKLVLTTAKEKGELARVASAITTALTSPHRQTGES